MCDDGSLPKGVGAAANEEEAREWMRLWQERQVVTQRTFAVPAERLFRAWLNPTELAHWWGPADFKNTFHEFDPRPGGHWRLDMHGPDGRSYRNESIFIEIEPPHCLVFEHITGPKYRASVTFASNANATDLTWRMQFDSAAVLQKLRPIIVAGNEQNLDRLQSLLTKTDT